MYEVILFDLDGTLTDSGEGITNSVAYSLEKYDIHVAQRTELYKFIGPPLLESYEKYYGFTEAEAKQAVVYYREYYREKGIFESVVYDGIEQLLKSLKNAGNRLLVATSKPEVFARQILEHFGLIQYFTYVAGSELDGTRSKKDEVIAYALQEGGIRDKDKTIMVGDRKHDIAGAKKNGLDSVGVLFGYGSRSELEREGASYIAENMKELAAILGVSI